MRRSNGWGTVNLISKDARKTRRRPYVARISVWDEALGKRKRLTIGTYKTAKDGYKALEMYQGKDRPPVQVPTVKELLDQALESLAEIRSEDTVSGYRTAIRKLERMWNVPIDELKGTDIQAYFDECIKDGIKYPVLSKRKAMLSEACRIALRMGVIQNDPTVAVDLRQADNSSSITRSVFTHEEIERLWGLSDHPYIRLTLCMIYTTARIQEAYNFAPEDLDLENHTLLIRGTKTKNATRTIPLCDRFFAYLSDFFKDNEQIVTDSFGYTKSVYYSLMKGLGFDHHSHDCRHTAITHLNSATLPNGQRIDLNVIKVISGHETSDITRGLYNHELFDKLVEAMATFDRL